MLHNGIVYDLWRLGIAVRAFASADKSDGGDAFRIFPYDNLLKKCKKFH